MNGWEKENRGRFSSIINKTTNANKKGEKKLTQRLIR